MVSRTLVALVAFSGLVGCHAPAARSKVSVVPRRADVDIAGGAPSPRAPLPVTAAAPTTLAVMDQLEDVHELVLGASLMGELSRGEQLTLALSRAPDAIEAFDWLIANGTPVSRMYAYWALLTLDPPRAREHEQWLASDDRTALVARGCIMTRRSVRDIAEELRMPLSNGARRHPMPELASPAPHGSPAGT
ncbi:MAG: hypothetical protein ACTHU0_24405 [Kofleriaceae bacterium]